MARRRRMNRVARVARYVDQSSAARPRDVTREKDRARAPDVRRVRGRSAAHRRQIIKDRSTRDDDRITV